MKIIFIAIVIFLSECCNASDSLPIVNRVVLNYAKSQLGKKVGNGICFTLVDKALSRASPDWKRRRERGLFGVKRRYVYGEKIKPDEILPGDIVRYNWKYRKERKTYSHVAIIYSVSENEVKVIEQNVDGSLTKSKVRINPLFLKSDSEIKYWKIKYYRPY
jgi:hypothetical protein